MRGSGLPSCCSGGFGVEFEFAGHRPETKHKSGAGLDLHLDEFAVPNDKLKESSNTEGAPKGLDQYLVEKAGAKLGFLYEDLIQDSFSYLDKQHDEAKAKGEKDWITLPVEAPESREKTVEERKKRGESRSSDHSALDICANGKGAAVEEAPPAKKINVGSHEASVILAERLKRTYGWTEDTFESA